MTDGTVERTNHGMWFADASDGTALGVYATRAAARAALRYYAEHGTKPGTHIRPTFTVGPPARGMEES